MRHVRKMVVLETNVGEDGAQLAGGIHDDRVALNVEVRVPQEAVAIGRDGKLHKDDAGGAIVGESQGKRALELLGWFRFLLRYGLLEKSSKLSLINSQSVSRTRINIESLF